MLPLGIQLYTVREYMQNDFYGTIKKVAEIGYKGVEFAGFYDKDPKEVRRFLDDNGLVCHSSHDPFPDKDNVNMLIDRMSVLGGTRSISGVGPDAVNTEDKAKRTIERFAAAAELFKGSGIRFAVHNHWWEFYIKYNGKTFFDMLCEQVPEIESELDLLWCAVGNSDPVEVIKKHPKNITMLHCKDGNFDRPWKEGDKVSQTANGFGSVGIDKARKAGEANCAEWAVVELDGYDGEMWDAVKDSHRWLTENGLAKGK
ncbi:MAG: sugar phosphate isomerase/epimerase, partial [Abditibacteriota bacterium]|nr:sugar phosphate isomerase/epimerase [Abditibacteriota bacterium]